MTRRKIRNLIVAAMLSYSGCQHCPPPTYDCPTGQQRGSDGKCQPAEADTGKKVAAS